MSKRIFSYPHNPEHPFVETQGNHYQAGGIQIEMASTQKEFVNIAFQNAEHKDENKGTVHYGPAWATVYKEQLDELIVALTYMRDVVLK